MNRVNEQEYYSKKLFANKLKRAYEMASPRIQQYLEAEIQYTLAHITPSDSVLELGCGYGRVLKRIAQKASTVVGIDISESSLEYARKFLGDKANIELFFMTARNLKFNPNHFDVVVGIQNAISALKINPSQLIRESLRVIKTGGKLILSSYSDKIWKDRLAWFIQQSQEGLLGEIDYEKTHDGVIVCKDGFHASTFTVEDFENLTKKMDLEATIEEIDQSSIFCIIEN
ncbi:MAG: methyltransferase domain-containing protein [Candidatus Hodarchaeales archaeon]|jgi:2-polyprenyl-6-hydroxyphenyl methylase/3-demethylubiquinone-9 3-methyltransferase